MVTLGTEYNLYNQFYEKQYPLQKVELITRQIRLVEQEVEKENSTQSRRVQKGLKIGEDQAIEMIERVNSLLQVYPVKLIYEIKEGKHGMIKLIHTANKKVIQEIPFEKPKEFVDLVWQLSGLFVNARA